MRLLAYSFIVCATLLQSARAEMSIAELKEASKMARKGCLKKVPVDEALLDKLQVGDFVEDPNVKCYTRCIHVMMQVMKKGRYDTNKAISNMKKVSPKDMIPKLEAMMEKCRDCGADQTDSCEVSWACVKCGFNASPQEFYFP